MERERDFPLPAGVIVAEGGTLPPSPEVELQRQNDILRQMVRGAFREGATMAMDYCSAVSIPAVDEIGEEAQALWEVSDAREMLEDL
jgi:hypothetical protein